MALKNSFLQKNTCTGREKIKSAEKALNCEPPPLPSVSIAIVEHQTPNDFLAAKIGFKAIEYETHERKLGFSNDDSSIVLLTTI